MTDLFLILTPFLVLAVIALLGFIGCDRVLGLAPVSAVSAVSRVFQQSANLAAGAGPFTATYTSPAGESGLIVIVSLHWGGSGGATPKITVNNNPPQPIESDTFNPQTVAHFFANQLGAGQIDVSVALTSGSNTAWDYCITIYKNADQTSSPFNSPLARQGTAQGTIPDAANQISFTSSNDNLIYAVAMSQLAGSMLGGNLSAGTDFAAVASPSSYFLVEEQTVDGMTTEPVIPSASVSGGTRWYFFATEIKHA